MEYKEAMNLEPGDKVRVKGREKVHRVEYLEGTVHTIFVTLDDGLDYRHDMLVKDPGM